MVGLSACHCNLLCSVFCEHLPAGLCVQLANDEAFIEESVISLYEQCYGAALYETRMQRGHAPVSCRNIGHLSGGPCHHLLICLPCVLQHEEGLTWAAFMRHMAIGLCGIHPCVMTDLPLAAHQVQEFGHLLCGCILTGGTVGLWAMAPRDSWMSLR